VFSLHKDILFASEIILMTVSSKNCGIFCIGYDVESMVPKTTRLFLKSMQQVHTKLNAPCTLFIKGQTLEKNIDFFRYLVQSSHSSLFDLQQHTYSHLIFKEIRQIEDGVETIIAKAEPIELIDEEIRKTSELFINQLNHKVTGLTTPYAFYRGLADNKDILNALFTRGIRFVRAYGRNSKGYSPVPLDVQPFFYSDQGFPDLLECPVNSWQDCLWRDRYGWKANWEKQLYLDIDYCAENNLYLCLCQHDWSSIKEDKDMKRTEAIIAYALKRNMKIMHFNDLYNFAIANRQLFQYKL
jgi:peptidoglycan/xylan/chitin deacetylase (PgdA/CDA1 family)